MRFIEAKRGKKERGFYLLILRAWSSGAIVLLPGVREEIVH